MKTILLLFGLLCTAASAQTTWIVDPNGGGNFTDLAPAIAAASPDDTLLVRAGTYVGPYTLDKPLHIVGDGPQLPLIDRIFRPSSAGAELASFRNLKIGRLQFYAAAVLEGVFADTVVVSTGATASLHSCTLGRGATPFGSVNSEAALMIQAASVAVSGSTIRGNPGRALSINCFLLAGDTVWMNGGALSIEESVIEGSDSNQVSGCPGWTPAGSGLVIYAGTVRLTRSSVRGGFDQNNLQTEAVWLDTPAVLRRDASVTFTPSTSLGSLVVYPATLADGAPPGGSITCTVGSDPNLPAVLVAGLGLRAPVSTAFGPAWLDPTANVILRIGFTDSAGVLSATISLPATAPTNLPLTFQGLVVPTGSTDLALGAPAIVQVL
ncbi:MAG: hypothetical protein KDE27_24675 [Planctomycetes bacterium]|nr:hypothetical protein [Planctomycetota bacterium]